MNTTAEKLQLWEQRIKERIQGGVTIGQWCKKNGVSKHQYYYWNRRIHEKEKNFGETTFADITPILSTADAAEQNPAVNSDFQVFFKSVRLIVPGDFNPSQLTKLMKVLQEL